MITKYCSPSKSAHLYQAKNAIILTAGLGKRLLPFTINTPKPLILVNGLPIIEHQIQCLKEAEIEEIYIVVGHLKEKFGYLQNKYKSIYLIENRQYNQKNNISSLQVAFNYFSNSYIIEGDLLIKENIFSLYHNSSSICCLYEKGKSNEWGLLTNKNGVLKQVNFTAEKQPHLIGISFWIESDAIKIKSYLNKAFNDPNHDNMFWEEASYVKNIGEFHIKTKLLNESAVKEIDTL
jgi:CTP:phosphocholine cytidylyltransferase-like protein